MASQQNYELFDPWDYVDEYDTVSDPFHRHSLKLLHEFYKSYGSPPAGLKVLEFGAGPVIIYEISASLYASEIVLSEYTEKNRDISGNMGQKRTFDTLHQQSRVKLTRRILTLTPTSL